MKYAITIQKPGLLPDSWNDTDYKAVLECDESLAEPLLKSIEQLLQMAAMQSGKFYFHGDRFHGLNVKREIV